MSQCSGDFERQRQVSGRGVEGFREGFAFVQVYFWVFASYVFVYRGFGGYFGFVQLVVLCFYFVVGELYVFLQYVFGDVFFVVYGVRLLFVYFLYIQGEKEISIGYEWGRFIVRRIGEEGAFCICYRCFSLGRLRDLQYRSR